MIAIFRANGIKGWRRGARIKFQAPRTKFQGNQTEPGDTKAKVPNAKSQGSPTRFQVKPDFVFRKLKLAVFVDGCFWHGCPRHFIKPRNNAAFWRAKIAANRTRDRFVNRTLRAQGWKVLRIWEHALGTWRASPSTFLNKKPARRRLFPS
jgi:DNA mismatch endonuclease (patch repair protein)